MNNQATTDSETGSWAGTVEPGQHDSGEHTSDFSRSGAPSPPSQRPSESVYSVSMTPSQARYGYTPSWAPSETSHQFLSPSSAPSMNTSQARYIYEPYEESLAPSDSLSQCHPSPPYPLGPASNASNQHPGPSHRHHPPGSPAAIVSQKTIDLAATEGQKGIMTCPYCNKYIRLLGWTPHMGVCEERAKADQLAATNPSQGVLRWKDEGEIFYGSSTKYKLFPAQW